MAMHVIQPPGIGLLLPHRVRRVASIPLVPDIGAQLLCLIAKTLRRRTPGPCGVFPLRLGGQTMGRAPVAALGVHEAPAISPRITLIFALFRGTIHALGLRPPSCIDENQG